MSLAVAVLGEITFSFLVSALDTGSSRLAGGEVAAFSVSAGGTFGQLACFWIAALCGTKVLRTAIAFFALLDDAVAARGADDLGGNVEQAVIHVLRERFVYGFHGT